MTRFLPVLIIAATTVLASGACTTPTSESTSVPGGADPGVEHVHGLGVDPADGVLYAATHYGLFRLPEQGDPVRVADRYQDTMGFTVNGPNTFLGSGHPDFVADPDFPTRLGLIRSDGGKGGRSCHSAGLPTSTPCTQPTAWCTDGILEPAGSWSPPTTGPVGTSAALWTCSTSRSARPTPTFCWPPPRHRESCAASMVGARGNRLVTLVARQAPGRQNRANVEATVRGYAGFPAAEW